MSRGNLNDAAIDDVLRRGTFGRLGYLLGDEVHVVPIAYGYDGRCIYGYSPPGTKLSAMRERPRVCFHVDDVATMSDWTSVSVWGEFEELAGSAADDAVLLLSHHLRAHPDAGDARSFVRRNAGVGSAFRIRIVKRTGAFERPSS